MEATGVRLVATPAGPEPQTLPSDTTRLSEMATRHFQFIWRSIRRLGVAEQAVDDAAQQVFVLAAEKIGQIAPGCERAFLFQTALRVAMSVRRTYAQRREALIGEQLEELVDCAPLPDASAEQRQMRRYLDELLDALPMELRAVFVLFEIEGVESLEIASILEIPVGTVASRLRRAREGFRAEAGRLRTRLERRVER
jgi:RNA polymerase sigma-70 factor (ECF subfamily)